MTAGCFPWGFVRTAELGRWATSRSLCLNKRHGSCLPRLFGPYSGASTASRWLSQRRVSRSIPLARATTSWRRESSCSLSERHYIFGHCCDGTFERWFRVRRRSRPVGGVALSLSTSRVAAVWVRVVGTLAGLLFAVVAVQVSFGRNSLRCHSLCRLSHIRSWLRRC